MVVFPCRSSVLLAALCLVLVTDAFKTDVQHAIRAVASRVLEPVSPSDAQANDDAHRRVAKPTGRMSTTEYTSRGGPTHRLAKEEAKAPQWRGMRFALRDDSRCFLVMLERPGDHVVANFRYSSNITTSPEMQASGTKGCNVTVEVFTPSWKYASQYSFPPDHPCLTRSCFVRGTPVRQEGAEHGVEAGQYALCFRKTAVSFIDQILQVFRRSADELALLKHEEITVELLSLTTTPRVLASAEPSPAVGRRGVSGSLQSNNERAIGHLPLKRVSSLANRLVLLEREVEDIAQEMQREIERQAAFSATSNSTFTRTWVCGLATVVVLSVVLWVERLLLVQTLRRKKLV